MKALRSGACRMRGNTRSKRVGCVVREYRCTEEKLKTLVYD